MKVLVFSLMLATVASADTVLGEATRSGVREKSIKVDPTNFTLEHVERICREELTREPRPHFIMLRVYGETGGAPLPQPAHGRTYAYWRNLRDQMPKVNEIAEMIAMGDRAVLRMRNAGGRVERRVLAGADPLQIALDDARYEILYVAFTTPSSYILQRVDVFVRTAESLRSAAGLELLRILRPVFPDFEVAVFIKNDGWFINERNYPFSNPFVEEEIPPSPSQYKTPTLRCGYWTGSPSCMLR